MGLNFPNVKHFIIKYMILYHYNWLKDIYEYECTKIEYYLIVYY